MGRDVYYFIPFIKGVIMNKYLFITTAVLLLLSLFTGCNNSQKAPEPKAAFDDNVTVSSLTTLVQYEAVPVRGYGIVAGLPGTGSPECPPALREELERFISKQIPNSRGFNARRFLDSSDTAVVEIAGTIPPLAMPGETFDVRLVPFSRSQTLSLDGGFLYTTELKEMSRFVRYDQFSKTMAEAHGQVFRDPFAAEGEARQWHLLGGGIVKNQVSISLAINKPDFAAAGTIRDRINERFGAKTANAVSSAEIRISIPRSYMHNKLRFLQMVQSLYLSEDNRLRSEKIASLVRDLQEQENKYPAEISLEAIGKPSLDALAPLLQSPDAATRLHAARCMLHIGDLRAMDVLNRIAQDPQNPYRKVAVEAFSAAAGSRHRESILVQFLADSDIEVRLAACDQLLKMNHFAVKRMVVADSFVIDQVLCAGEKAIYVSRKDVPRIVLFGSPIRCDANVFLQSDDGSVTLNALPDQKYISVSRQHPHRPRVIGPVPSSRELSSLVRTLGESSEIKDRAVQPGLSIPYLEIISLLKKMCQNNAVAATFTAGPMTEVIN